MGETAPTAQGVATRTSPALRRRGILFLTLAAWASSVGVGMAALWNYAGKPGGDASAPSIWPDSSSIPRRTDGHTLLMFIHPRCPCTRASLEELSRLMCNSGDDYQVHAVVSRPAGASPDWEETDITRTIAAFPGVVVHVDGGGVETRRFGALTSGAVLLYDRNGSLRFSGGITAARGHIGDNAGRRAVTDHLRGRNTAVPSMPVYGCGLLDAPASSPCCNSGPAAEEQP